MISNLVEQLTLCMDSAKTNHEKNKQQACTNIRFFLTEWGY